MEEGSPQLVVRETALHGIFWVLFPHHDPVSRRDLNLFNSFPPALQPPFNEGRSPLSPLPGPPLHQVKTEEGNVWDFGERVPLKAHKENPLHTTDTEWPDRWEENEGTWHGNQGGKVAWPLSKWKGKSIKLKRPRRGHSTQSLFSERKRWAPHRVSKTESPHYLHFFLKEPSIFGCFSFFNLPPFTYCLRVNTGDS